MPAGGLSNLAFNLAEDVPLSAEGAAEWATAEPDRRRRVHMHYFDWDRFDAGQGDKAEAAEQGGAPAPPAASRVARSE